MTVKELIEKLQDTPRGALVCFTLPNGGRVPIQGVRLEPPGAWEVGPDDNTALVVLSD